MTNNELMDALANFDTECNHNCSQCEFECFGGSSNACPLEVVRGMIYMKENNREQYNRFVG